MEGIEESELSIIIFEVILIEAAEFDLKLACLEIDIIVQFDCLLWVQHGVERFEIRHAFWIGMDAILRPHFDSSCIVEGGLKEGFFPHTVETHASDVCSKGLLSDCAVANWTVCGLLPLPAF